MSKQSKCRKLRFSSHENFVVIFRKSHLLGFRFMISAPIVKDRFSNKLDQVQNFGFLTIKLIFMGEVATIDKILFSISLHK